MAQHVATLPAIIKRHSFPAFVAFASVMAAAFAYLIFSPRLYEATARLMLDEKKVSISDLGRDLTQVPDSAPGGPSPLATQAELIKSQRVLKRAIATVAASDPTIAPTTEQLAKAIRVKIVPATNILELTYRGKNPEQAATLLNAVLTAMVEENGETIRAEARSVRKFLEAEVPKQRNVLTQSEAAENAYRQSNNLVSVEEQTRRMVESLGIAENQERELSAQLRETLTRNISLQRIINAGPLSNAYAAVRVGQDDNLKTLRAKLVDLETKVIDARSRLGDRHPDLLALVEQRDETRALYTQKLSRLLPPTQTATTADPASDQLSQDLISKLIVGEVERQALEQKLFAVRVGRTNLQSRLAELPGKQQPLTNLTRQREEAELSLKFLQAKLQEARLAEAQLLSNIQVIAEAQPPTTATWPRKSVVLVVATILGLVLATAIVLLLELLDNTLRNAPEAEELLGQPLLGVLPNLPTPTVQLSHTEQFLDSADLVEPYRMLLKTLEFRSTKQLRLIVISSPLPNEGKSVVVAHLATVAAMLGQRTLVIDANLRHPSQHWLFNLPPKPGLTDVLDGDRSFLQAIHPTDNNYLSVLTFGEMRQRPSRLLESIAMKTLLSEAVEQFDLVIVDTPPLGSCVDAVTLARQSDGLIVVTRPNCTPREVLSRTFVELKENGVPLLGFVVNGADGKVERESTMGLINGQRAFSEPFQRLPLVGHRQNFNGNRR